jgi:DNA polymerase III delta prime subunit
MAVSSHATSEPREGQEPERFLTRALASGRVHSSFLLSGGGTAPREAALRFVRGVVCRGGEGDGESNTPRPCGSCRDCQLSGAQPSEGQELTIDGTGKRGPLYRHVGDHPDLYFVDRGDEGTRVRISQVRALQQALRLAANEGGWRAAVIADAEWLNVEAQNALLHLLEEPPDRTCLVLVTNSSAGLLATIRSRCQKVPFARAGRPALDAASGRGEQGGEGGEEDEAAEELSSLAARLDAIGSKDLSDLLDWAEEYRGARAVAAARLQTLLTVGSEWLRQRVASEIEHGNSEVRDLLEAFRALGECRKDLAQRNANPQMVAERALFAVRSALST